MSLTAWRKESFCSERTNGGTPIANTIARMPMTTMISMSVKPAPGACDARPQR